jgi:hypothetical protein
MRTVESLLNNAVRRFVGRICDLAERCHSKWLSPRSQEQHKRKSDFGSPGPAPAHQRAAGGVLARRPEILFARHTLPPAAGEELRPLFRPHSATDHRTTTPRSPRMAAMRAAPPSSLR